MPRVGTWYVYHTHFADIVYLKLYYCYITSTLNKAYVV